MVMGVGNNMSISEMMDYNIIYDKIISILQNVDYMRYNDIKDIVYNDIKDNLIYVNRYDSIYEIVYNDMINNNILLEYKINDYIYVIKLVNR